MPAQGNNFTVQEYYDDERRRKRQPATVDSVSTVPIPAIIIQPASKWASSRSRSQQQAIKVTAPEVNGQKIIEVTFCRHGLSDAGSESLRYSADTHGEAAAICVAGFAQGSSRPRRPLRAQMCTIHDGRVSKPWFDWSLNPKDWPELESTWTLQDKLRDMFKVLLVTDPFLCEG